MTRMNISRHFSTRLNLINARAFLTCFRDAIRVTRIENWVPRIKKIMKRNIYEILLEIFRLPTKGGHGSGVPESTLAGFCVFLSDPGTDRSQKFVTTRIQRVGLGGRFQ